MDTEREKELWGPHQTVAPLMEVTWLLKKAPYHPEESQDGIKKKTEADIPSGQRDTAQARYPRLPARTH